MEVKLIISWGAKNLKELTVRPIEGWLRMILKKPKHGYPGEYYLESKRYLYLIQKPFYSSKTVTFIARRFAKALGKFNGSESGYCDIAPDGTIVRGCCLPPTTLKTAKKRIMKSFEQRYNPKVNLSNEYAWGLRQKLDKNI